MGHSLAAGLFNVSIYFLQEKNNEMLEKIKKIGFFPRFLGKILMVPKKQKGDVFIYL